MLTFSAYFVLVINVNQINGFHLFWDTLYILRFQKIQSLINGAHLCIIITERHIAQNVILFHIDWL